MAVSALENDLDYIRDLAEAGQNAPLLGGRFLTWWGGLAAAAYTGHFLIISGMAGVSPNLLGWLWMAFGIIGLSGYFILLRTMPRDKPGQSSMGNRVEASVWKISGFALFVYFFTLMLKAFAGGDIQGFAYSLPVVFALYAVGLYCSGKIGQNLVLLRAGYLALGIVALAVWFQATLFIWAIAALGAFLTVFLPGVMLLRNEPKRIV